jgi:hypothetical protein
MVSIDYLSLVLMKLESCWERSRRSWLEAGSDSPVEIVSLAYFFLYNAKRAYYYYLRFCYY